MSLLGLGDAAFDASVAAQRRAADPAVSAWVSANAGAGKTRVLVDRIARLLLAGAPPARVLAITYTKAAAAEMQSRLFQQLGAWSVAPDDRLVSALSELDGRVRAPEDLPAARRLFARALETPGGLKIQTIHGFCQAVLQRFPLEAGLPPGFTVLDDAAARALKQASKADALQAPEARAALARLAEDADDDALDTALASAASRGGEMADVLADGLEAAIVRLWARVDLPRGTSPDDVLAAAWATSDRDAARAAADALRAGGMKDQAAADAIDAALATADAAAAFAAYQDAFLVADGSKPRGSAKQGFPSKAIAGRAAVVALYGPCDGSGPEAARLMSARDTAARAALAERSQALLTLAAGFAAAYGARKQAAGALDFDDLIARAHSLLTAGQGAAAWVLFKLDQGVDHVLIDEGQDTSPAQWRLLQPLFDEFEAGAGVRDAPRTRFAVGDEKQSIFSFQGADPEEFRRQRAAFEAVAAARGQAPVTPELTLSFRTAPEILRLVDAVCAEVGWQGVHHEARRAGQPGRVEVWPLAPPSPTLDDRPSWEAPLDAAGGAHPQVRLAAAIAETVRRALAEGHAVWDGARRRPLRPGDVMILMRKRTGRLFSQTIRALKRAGVPVAGADRIVLAEEIAVQDLLALARFALTPGDDLTLACVLKGPFVGLLDDDADLFPIAYGRSGRLWDALRARPEARYREAAAFLEQVRARAQSLPPYEFFAAALEQPGIGAATGWARLLGRLGQEAREPAEALLTRAAGERDPASGLQAFVRRMETDAAEIKREAAGAETGVRVMTTHGAKGLEAPLVILPDTTAPPAASEKLFFDSQARVWLWSPVKSAEPALLAQLREAAEAAARRESDRLLYVGLTRARDRLIVCGAWHGGDKSATGFHGASWRAAVERATADWPSCDTPFGPGRCTGPEPQALGPAVHADAPAGRIPVWLDAPVAAEAPVRRVAPSSLLEDGPGPPAASPVATDAARRFARGVAIHDLLQRLPDVPPPARQAVAERRLARHGDVSAPERAAWIAEALAVLDHPDVAAAFAPGSRAEAPVIGTGPGLPPGLVVNGAIDRLAVLGDEVLVVDFKTNRPPPARVEEVAPVYLAQMAAYRAVLSAVFPGRRVRAALIWTDGPTLMTLPDATLDAALQGLARAHTSPAQPATAQTPGERTHGHLESERRQL